MKKTICQERKKEIINSLIAWYEVSGRSFPWRKQPLSSYEILVAEMMLQKTQADNVAKYFCNFVKRYPNIDSLNSSSMSDLVDQIRPLGLYNRKSLWMKLVSHKIVKDFDGIIPASFEDLIKLPGIGQYIASAILCFAFNKPITVLDVNVGRIISRLEGVGHVGDLRRNKKIQETAEELTPSAHFKEFNWALIDLGGLVCTFSKPRHDVCPIKNLCWFAQEEKKVKTEPDRRNSC